MTPDEPTYYDVASDISLLARQWIGPEYRMNDRKFVRKMIRKHLSDDEIRQAAEEFPGVGKDSDARRGMIRRMSAAGDFRPWNDRSAHTLQASISDRVPSMSAEDPHLPGPQGVDRIALALRVREIAQEGAIRGMPENATLGQVCESMEADRAAGKHGISGMPEPTTKMDYLVGEPLIMRERPELIRIHPAERILPSRKPATLNPREIAAVLGYLAISAAAFFAGFLIAWGLK